ncbi:MAG: molybdenum cofactor guanylyltransferase [Mycobacteriales bacterium]
MYDVLVLAGGSARRMGGVDKPALTVGDRTLLDRVLDAVPAEAGVVVVGPERPTARPVRWVREDPPGAGPVAAVRAGLPLVTADLVVLLAGDLPFLRPDVLQQLVDAVVSDGALLVDDTGRDQYLCSAWRTGALRSADLGADRLGRLLGPLDAVRLTAAGYPPPWTDCDTEDDLREARARA